MAEKCGFITITDLLNLYQSTQFEQLIQRAMAGGSKPWNRSKIMLVGEGRVGKTALCNSMMGKSFVETESTVGLTQLTCDVRSAAATTDGRWTEHMKPEREFEAGIAQLIRELHESKRKPTAERMNEPLSPRDDVRMPSDQINSNVDNGEPAGTKITEETRSTSDLPQVNSHIPQVMRYLADVKVSDADLILSLFDFGGQSVFNIIHHLFLTTCGVYVVVFNMLSILDDNSREQSLNELSFWIKSIYMHTSTTDTDDMAPVFLVGTHKDIVNKSSMHKQISDTIREKFERHSGWPSIKEYEDLCFFPVNNRINKPRSMLQSLDRIFSNVPMQDPVCLELLIRIENTVKKADYVREPRPLTWLRALDEMKATKRNFLTMKEASDISMANGVENYTVHHLLSFLNEMGEVLWLDEEGLRDVVILDPVTFFVEPATLIICNHISESSGSSIHHKDIQKKSQKSRPKEWVEMTQRGLISQQFMEFLLVQKVETGIIHVVINMMLKYGLIARLEHTTAQSLPIYYLVPALLPATVCDHTAFKDDVWRNIHDFNSCYFIFTTESRLCRSTWYNVRTLQEEGFLPAGLMERLICKAA